VWPIYQRSFSGGGRAETADEAAIARCEMYDELETTTKALYESHRKRMKLSGALLVPWDKLTVHNQAHWRGVAKHALDQTRTVTAPLNKLRVSLARIGQNAALDIPGCNFKTANFTELSRAAQDEERGWNGLAAGISDAIELLQREVEGLQQRNRELDNENVRIERENSDLREEVDELTDELEAEGLGRLT